MPIVFLIHADVLRGKVSLVPECDDSFLAFFCVAIVYWCLVTFCVASSIGAVNGDWETFLRIVQSWNIC